MMTPLASLIRLALVSVLAVTGTLARAQSNPKLNDAIRKETVEKLSRLLAESYVIPETGRKLAGALTNNLKNGKYNAMGEFGQFAAALNKDMSEIAHDKHLNIYYSVAKVAELRQTGAFSEAEKELFHQKEKAAQSQNNFGFEKLEILNGNIGYLKLTTFADTFYAGNTAIAAMNFLENSNAIIIDLRDNNGGGAGMVQLLASWFYALPEQDRVDRLPLFEDHVTQKNQINSYRILPYLPVKRLPKTPLYILVDKQSISAAEIFAYTMQKSGRATVVGEKTNYGVNSTRGPQILNDYFAIALPVGRLVHPITKTNCEGVGVQPDVVTEGRHALEAAIGIIREKQPARKATEAPMQAAEGLRSYLGRYEFNPGTVMTISVTGEQVFAEITGRPTPFEIFPAGKDTFNVPGMGITVEFLREGESVTGLKFTRNDKINHAKKVK